MWIFLLRRMAQAIPVLIGISLLTFVLIYYLPADPARMYAGPSATVETVARIRHRLLETHAALTGSVFAQRILDDFRDFLGKFWLVKPKAASLESLVETLRRAA